MTKHIKIKVLTRLQKPFEDYQRKRFYEVCQLSGYPSGSYNLIIKKYCEKQNLEFDSSSRVYNVSWINKHDTSLDKTFNNPLDKLESLSIR